MLIKPVDMCGVVWDCPITGICTSLVLFIHYKTDRWVLEKE